MRREVQSRLEALESQEGSEESAPVYIVDDQGQTSRPVDVAHKTIVLLPAKQARTNARRTTPGN